MSQSNSSLEITSFCVRMEHVNPIQGNTSTQAEQATLVFVDFHRPHSVIVCSKFSKGSFIIFALEILTQIHGCLRASEDVMRLAGLTVSILLIRFLASGVTVSHSGDGY